MEICTTKAAMRECLAPWRAGGQRIGLVPTMGALHDGHMALVAAAKAACTRVVVSIFVNPTQFGDANDLAKYPRTEDADLAMLRAAGVDAVFMPDAGEVYHPEAQTFIEPERLGNMLMGALRAGHFRGVCTVVAKLFNIIQPDQAFFGEKDFQQLAVIRTMVRDLDFPIEITGVPTMREPDGLAMSSRNRRLGPDDRAAATILSRALDRGAARIADGAKANALATDLAEFIATEPRAHVETVDIRDAATLAELPGVIAAPAVILLAVRFGDVLLIDQKVAFPKGTA
ncbi:MAG: pantoate--beta-alanine ligase [Paracoccaceae bacterium]